MLIALLLAIALALRWLPHRPHQAMHAFAMAVQHESVTTEQSAPWTSVQRRRLGASLDDAFAPALTGADRWSLAVMAADGRLIYDNRAAQSVTPASVQKLLVASVALDILGPYYRYHSLLAATQAVASDGALPGDLWLVGSGDPSLRSDDLRAGVGMLARAGLRRIGGRVAVDASTMRGTEMNQYWSIDDANEDFQTATSAISLDGDTAEFRVYGTTPGRAARVVVVPPNGVVHLAGEIATSSRSDDVIIAAMSPNHFELEGDIPAGAEEKYWLPVHDIPHYAGSVLQALLRERSIATAGSPVIATAPLDAVVLWDHASAPLAALERRMLYVSDNHYAEQILRTLGTDANTSPDNAGGLAVETHVLASHGIPMPGLHIVDGSGLARSDRIAALTLASVLAAAQARGGAESLYLLMPQGGREGTLRNYDFTTALGRVRAKTGHMDGVNSLAGYVNTEHHGRVAFAFLINGSPGDPDAAIVRAVDRLAAL